MRTIELAELHVVAGGDGDCITGVDVLTLAGYSVLLGLSGLAGPLAVAGAGLALLDKASEIIDKEEMCPP